MKQSISGRTATGEEAQRVSDEAHDNWRKHMDRDVRACLERFLEDPQFTTLERMTESAFGVLRAVEARRRK